MDGRSRDYVACRCNAGCRSIDLAGLQVNVTGSRGAGDTVLAERIDMMSAAAPR